MARRQNEQQSLSDALKNFVSENKLQKGLDKVETKLWQRKNHRKSK